jgi:hypothetical protein
VLSAGTVSLRDVSRPRGQHKLDGFISLEAREGRRDSPQPAARIFVVTVVTSAHTHDPPFVKERGRRWYGNTVTREGSKGCRRSASLLKLAREFRDKKTVVQRRPTAIRTA